MTTLNNTVRPEELVIHYFDGGNEPAFEVVNTHRDEVVSSCENWVEALEDMYLLQALKADLLNHYDDPDRLYDLLGQCGEHRKALQEFSVALELEVEVQNENAIKQWALEYTQNATRQYLVLNLMHLEFEVGYVFNRFAAEISNGNNLRPDLFPYHNIRIDIEEVINTLAGLGYRLMGGVQADNSGGLNKPAHYTATLERVADSTKVGKTRGMDYTNLHAKMDAVGGVQ